MHKTACKNPSLAQTGAYSCICVGSAVRQRERKRMATWFNRGVRDLDYTRVQEGWVFSTACKQNVAVSWLCRIGEPPNARSLDRSKVTACEHAFPPVLTIH